MSDPYITATDRIDVIGRLTARLDDARAEILREGDGARDGDVDFGPVDASQAGLVRNREGELQVVMTLDRALHGLSVAAPNEATDRRQPSASWTAAIAR